MNKKKRKKIIKKNRFNIRQVTDHRDRCFRQILALEQKVFGKGAAHSWVLAPFILEHIVLVTEFDDEFLAEAIFLYTSCVNSLFFFSYAIEPDKQGRGLGKSSFIHNVNFIFHKMDNIQKIRLTVDPRKEKNLGIFKSVGFEKITSLPEFYGYGEDRIYMNLDRGVFYEKTGLSV